MYHNINAALCKTVFKVHEMRYARLVQSQRPRFVERRRLAQMWIGGQIDHVTAGPWNDGGRYDSLVHYTLVLPAVLKSITSYLLGII